MNNYINYAKHIGGDEFLLNWVKLGPRKEIERETKYRRS